MPDNIKKSILDGLIITDDKNKYFKISTIEEINDQIEKIISEEKITINERYAQLDFFYLICNNKKFIKSSLYEKEKRKVKIKKVEKDGTPEIIEKIVLNISEMNNKYYIYNDCIYYKFDALFALRYETIIPFNKIDSRVINNFDIDGLIVKDDFPILKQLFMKDFFMKDLFSSDEIEEYNKSSEYLTIKQNPVYFDFLKAKMNLKDYLLKEYELANHIKKYRIKKIFEKSNFNEIVVNAKFLEDRIAGKNNIEIIRKKTIKLEKIKELIEKETIKKDDEIEKEEFENLFNRLNKI